MHSKTFLGIFVATHLVFIFLHIHKQVQCIKHSFTLQKHEKQLHEKTLFKNELTKQLYTLKNLQTIKQYAQKELHMHPIVLHQIKQLGNYDN